MKLFSLNISRFTILYLTISSISIALQFIDFNLFLEFCIKIAPLLVIVFFYVRNTDFLDINYLLILTTLFLSEMLNLYGHMFYELMIYVKLASNCLFIWIISEILSKQFLKSILKYFLIYLFATIVIYFYIVKEINNISIGIPITLLYLFTSLLGTLTFVNLIYKNSKKSLYYAIAIFIFSTSDVFSGIDFFIGKSTVNNELIYSLRLLAMCFFYFFMIEKNDNRKNVLF